LKPDREVWPLGWEDLQLAMLVKGGTCGGFSEDAQYQGQLQVFLLLTSISSSEYVITGVESQETSYDGKHMFFRIGI